MLLELVVVENLHAAIGAPHEIDLEVDGYDPVARIATTRAMST
jgi:hypothetical protein